MYAYISGTVEAVFADSIILDNHGIGYRIFMPSSAADVLKRGEEYRIYTHFSVREDAMQLFGFLSEDDLSVYRMLIGVSGVGPKGALAIMSVLGSDDLRFAILSDDAAAVAKAPGIGRKTAQKVILELKDKFSLEDAFEKKSLKSRSESHDSMEAEALNDAVMALVSLGYSASEAGKAARKALADNPEADSSKLISVALREMA